MRALLGSGGIRTDERKALYIDETRRHFGEVNQVLFIPWALDNHDAYVSLMNERGLDAGYELVGIHTFDDPIAAIKNAEAISVGGGNTFRLTWELQRSGAMNIIRSRVLDDGIPYMGVSAGTNVACPTMQTTNDMPIARPESFATLGLVHFQVNAHYFGGSTWVRLEDGTFAEHFGETRNDRLREYHELNDIPVVGLREGSFLRCDDSSVELIGSAARIFRSGEDAVEVDPGTDLVAFLD
ncbi:MAG: dipeptidase PepE [Planctomycetes bacterium]|jgi:dipeptidase E|nr:dipeptidase PepE [Planctomycetota bacterium]MCP4838353.1 dipeptidase PepE [Planctomycetota bacterium]